MRGLNRSLRVACVLVSGLMLSGCESLDIENMFSNKKPLPGERKEVFPTGVPGVPQGVPAELVQGYQPPPEPVPEPIPMEKPKAKPKAKAKPKQAAAPARQPAGQVPPQRQQQPPSAQNSPFPDPPRSSGTFQR